MPISHYFSRYFYGVTRDVNRAKVRYKWAVFDFFPMMPFGPCPTPPDLCHSAKMLTARLFLYLVEAGTASFTRTFSWKEVLGTQNRSDPDSASITCRNVNLLKNPPAWPHIKIIFISFITNKKQTIAYWARLLITYSLEVIPLNSHTSLISYVKNSCFVFHQGFQTPRSNKSNRPAASCFHLFLGVWNPWWNTRTRFWHITCKKPIRLL